MKRIIKIIIVSSVLFIGWKFYNSNIGQFSEIEHMEMLVNKQNALPTGYEPSKLQVPDVAFVSYANATTRGMHPEAATALEKMFRAAKRDGVTLLAVSGYRSYDYQNTLYHNQVNTNGADYASKYVAKPGESEHQTGLAMDVDSDEQTQLSNSFQGTEAYKWIVENGAEYGFIIRYLKDKEEITGYNFEPWHIRYVGVDVAKEIVGQGMTLEEYLER